MRGLYSLIMDENERFKEIFFFKKGKQILEFVYLTLCGKFIFLGFLCFSQWAKSPIVSPCAPSQTLSTQAPPPTQPALISSPCCRLDMCVCGAGSRFSSPPLLSVRRYRGGESSAARKRNKTMESVRHSTANGFTAASPPPSLFMCKSIHRVLMAPAMHDTDSFKWPRERKKKRIFHTPAELAENNSGGLYWISISLCQNGAKCLFTVLMHCVMALVWFWLIFASDWLYSALYPSPSWALFCRTTRHKELLESRAVLLTPQDRILTSKC